MEIDGISIFFIILAYDGQSSLCLGDGMVDMKDLESFDLKRRMSSNLIRGTGK